MILDRDAKFDDSVTTFLQAIVGYPSKLEIIRRPTTENIATTLMEIALVIDQRFVGGRAPFGARTRIGELGENAFYRHRICALKCYGGMVQFLLHASRLS